MNLFQKKHDWVLGGFEFLRADTTVETDPGSGGSLFAVDANGSTLHPYAKMEFGASGTQTPVSAANPLPVVQTGTPGLPTGAATAAKQDTEIVSLATLAGAVDGTEVQVDVLTMPVVAVTDNSGSLTIDTPQLPTTIGQKAAAASVSVVLASDQGGVPVTGTFYQATQPVSAASLPLPTGAATAAKQPALGTAGTASTDVISVQGIASMTPLLVNGSGVTQPVSDAGGSLTVDSAQLPAALDGSGNLKVAIMSGAGSGGTAMDDDAAFTPGTTAVTPAAGIYRSTLDAVDDGDAGAFAMTANRAMHVNLRAADGSELTAGDQYAEDAAHASGDFLTMAGAVRRDTAAVGSGTDGDNSTLNVNSVGRLWTTAVIDTALPAGTNNIGLVTDVPGTSGGWAISTLLSANTTNATSAKGSAGQVGGWYLYNANAAVRYLKLYNKATAPTVGTDVPVMTIPIPPGSAANVEFGKGIAFATGIAFAITTGVGTADTGAVAANEIIVNLMYK